MSVPVGEVTVVFLAETEVDEGRRECVVDDVVLGYGLHLMPVFFEFFSFTDRYEKLYPAVVGAVDGEVLVVGVVVGD